jgi:hypothetical protein
MNFEFRMVFKLGPTSADADTLVVRLGAAGCDDACVGIGHPGRIALDFARNACSVKEAVLTAIRDVKTAIPDAELIELKPELAGFAELSAQDC